MNINSMYSRVTPKVMAQIVCAAVLVVALIFLSSCKDNLGSPVSDNSSDMTISNGGSSLAGSAVTGNGALSGAHYNLNIIGASKDKTADLTNNGHRIFVPLIGTTKIYLSE